MTRSLHPLPVQPKSESKDETSHPSLGMQYGVHLHSFHMVERESGNNVEEPDGKIDSYVSELEQSIVMEKMAGCMNGTQDYSG